MPNTGTAGDTMAVLNKPYTTMTTILLISILAVIAAITVTAIWHEVE